jgi:hypothetical protein
MASGILSKLIIGTGLAAAACVGVRRAKHAGPSETASERTDGDLAEQSAPSMPLAGPPPRNAVHGSGRASAKEIDVPSWLEPIVVGHGQPSGAEGNAGKSSG